jgi:hypothetical protein
MPSEMVISKQARMLRFLTPTEDWARRVCNPIGVPSAWPLMMAEIFVTEDGVILTTCTVGVPKSCVKAFFAQGIYVYQLRELPDAIIDVLDRHFVQVEEDLRSKLDSLLPTFKPKLILVKK